MPTPSTNTVYPAALDNLPTIAANDREDATGLEHDVVHDIAHGAINALQAEVGTDDNEIGSVRGRLVALEAIDPLLASQLGVGVCELVDGVVPSARLPSYVDDVLEYANLAAFPATGVAGKIYIAADTGLYYRWTGSAYFAPPSSPGTTDDVLEGSTNLYFTVARVLATVLTGLSTASAAVVTATDTVLQAIGKLQRQASDLATAVADRLSLSETDLQTLAGSLESDGYLQGEFGIYAADGADSVGLEMVDGQAYLWNFANGGFRFGTNDLERGRITAAGAFEWDYALSALSLSEGATRVALTGKHAVPIHAGSIIPSATGGCAELARGASGANLPDLVYLAFDATTKEYAQFSIYLPKGWDRGTITARFVWSHAATATNFGVCWGLQAVAISDNEAIGTAFGTAQEVTDTGGTTDRQYVSSDTAAITVAGTPADGDVVYFRVYRDPANGADNLAVDARLHQVVLFLSLSAGNDA